MPELKEMAVEEQKIIEARRAYQRQWRAANKDKVKEHNLRYYKKTHSNNKKRNSIKCCPKKLVALSDLNHEDWLEWRRKGIGGSDSATIAGLNPYGSLYELWADKQGFLSPKEDNEAMRTGRDLEQYVAERFCEATGKKVKRLPYMYSHKDYSFITANIDRKVVGENAGLECKTTNLFNRTDFEGGEVQPNYICQCWHYMNVMGYDKMYLAVLILGKGFFWYEIEKDEAQQAALLKAEVEFWEKYVIGDEVPLPDGSESSERAIKAIYGKENQGEEVNLMHCDKLLEKYAAVSAEIKDLELSQKKLKEQIQLCLGEAESGCGSDYKITWKTQVRTTVDSKELAAKYPQVYEELKKESRSRRFCFAERKK